MNTFTQEVSNGVQVTLCPGIDKLVQSLWSCLGTMPKAGAGENRIPSLQLGMIQNRIREVGLTARNVYHCSKNFLVLCNV